MIGIVLALSRGVVAVEADPPVSERATYDAFAAGPWTPVEKDDRGTGASATTIGWTVREGRLYLLCPTATGTVARAAQLRLRDAQSGASVVQDLEPTLARGADSVRLSAAGLAGAVEVEAVLVTRSTHLAGAVRLRGLGAQDRPLRVEFVVAAPGSDWRWWDDARRSRPVGTSGEYANLTRVVAGFDGQMSRYPYACLSSASEALSLAIPVLHPRVFQLVYDGAASEYRLAVDLTLSPATAKFPNEATFFFSVFPSDPGEGFRGVIERYRRIYPEAFVNRVTQEGVWMPFTRINDVRDAQDFQFGFHEYGAVDFEYNRKHGILSFLYVEPWTYWMAMPEDLPRETATALRLLEKNAAEGDAWNQSMAVATRISAMQDGPGAIAHQFVDQPWCKGALFFNNSDPDVQSPGQAGLNAGRLNLDQARRSVVEARRVVWPGWDFFAGGYQVGEAATRDRDHRGICLERKTGEEDRGAVQVVNLNQTRATPLWISGYSRAEEVTPGDPGNYALYADITYANGSNSWGHLVGFDAGTHSWQQRELMIRPEAPVKAVKLHALLRGERYGRAWFDRFEMKEISNDLADRIQPSPWAPFERGFVVDPDRPHGGHQGIRVDRHPGQAPGGAWLRLVLDQPAPAPLILKAWSRARDVPAAPPDADYAVHADVYFADGSAEFGVAVPFVASGSWHAAERLYRPEQAVKAMHLHLVFRGAHTGSAWFDDVSVRDAASGRDYVVDGGFERSGSGPFRAELEGQPNRLRDGNLTGIPIELRADGMYLDSMEGWANRLNFRKDHFAAVDLPLAYETGSGRTAIFNLFSIFEFTRAMADYLHDHDRWLMGNWVLIDYPFLGALLDVPGKEVHWLDTNHAFVPDPDDVMLYRRSLSGPKPYPLLLNVQFEHLTPAMMRMYFERSLFYAFYPGVFSHDAATHPYFEDPALYERDRDLFLKYIPLVRTLSRAGWQPVTHATSSTAGVLVERYGQTPEEGLYVALHHDGWGRAEARGVLDRSRLGLTNAIRLVDARDGGALAAEMDEKGVAFSVTLGDYETRVVRVLEVRPGSLARYAGERLDEIRTVMDRHEEQAKVTGAQAAQGRAQVQALGRLITTGDVDDLVRAQAGLQRVRDAPGFAGRVDFVRAVAAAENAVSDALAAHLGLTVIPNRPSALISPSEVICGLEVSHAGRESVDLLTLRTTADPALGSRVRDLTNASVRLRTGEAAHWTQRITLPAGLPPGHDYTLRMEVEGKADGRADGKPLAFRLVQNIEVRSRPGYDLRLEPTRLLAADEPAGLSVVIENRREAPLSVSLSAQAVGDGAAVVSWTQTQVCVESEGVQSVPLHLTIPAVDRPTVQTVLVRAEAEGAVWASVTSTVVRVPMIRHALMDTSVEVRVDSTFAGYTVHRLRDGVVETAGLTWSEKAWASGDLTVPHWMEARWSEPRRLTGVTIHWAEDGGAYFRSTDYRLQYRVNGDWREVTDTRREDEGRGLTRHAFTPVVTDGLRLWQEAGGGSAARPNLLWLREVEVRCE